MADGWQPIETAPRDGTTVLCFWTTDEPVDEQNYGLAKFEAGSWRNPDDAQDEYRDPSHWQPLHPPGPPIFVANGGSEGGA